MRGDDPSLPPLGCTSIFTSIFLAGFRCRLSCTKVEFCEEVRVAPGQLSLCVLGLINAFQILSNLSGITIFGRMIAGAYELEESSAAFRRFELKLCTGRNLQLVCRINWTCPRRREPISSLGARSLTVPSDFGLLMVHYSHISLCLCFLNHFPSSPYIFALFIGFLINQPSWRVSGVVYPLQWWTFAKRFAWLLVSSLFASGV